MAGCPCTVRALHVLDPQRPAAPVRLERGHGVFPLVLLLLLRLSETVKRPRIARIALQVLPEHILRLGILTVAKKRGTERLAHGIEPVGRLIVIESVLRIDRRPVRLDRVLRMTVRLEDAAVEEMRSDGGDHLWRVLIETEVVGERFARGFELLTFAFG